MSVIDKAKAHYQELTLEISVPEWDCVVHAAPLTLSERELVNKRAGGKQQSLVVEALILKARDAAGDPMFTRGDKIDLLKSCDANVIERVALEIVGDVSLEEAVKN